MFYAHFAGRMHGLKSGSCRFWQLTDLPRAQTCCAELRRLARLANSPGFKSFRCPRWRIKFSLERFSDQSRLRAQPLKNSAGRVPQAADGTCKKFRKPDRVGRRGLSEPGGIFSRLITYAVPWLYPWLYPSCAPQTNAHQ